MKTKSILSCFVAIATITSFTACDKQAATPPTPPPSTNAMTSTVDAAKDLTGKAVDAAKDATATAVDATKSAATNAMAAVKDATATATTAVKDAVAPAPAVPDATTTLFTEVVANSKKMLADKNYQGVLDELKKLADVKLSDDQQKIIDGLKAEAQKMISSAGAGAVNSLLGK